MSFQAATLPHPTHNIPTIWRSKSVLVMAKRAPLPARCVKCNAPAQRTLKRNLRWHHPALYLSILGSMLVYVILALVLSKSATIHVGLCDTHFAARKRDIILSWFLVLLSFGVFYLAAVAEEMNFLFVGIFVLLGAMIYGVGMTRVVVPKKIDDQYVWLAGIDDDYLKQFPELTPRLQRTSG
jgi:hypothetical protein